MGIDFRKIRINMFKKKHCLDKECGPCTHSTMIDTPEYFKCSHEKHPDMQDIRHAEEKINEVHVEAFDEKGRTFDKTVIIEDEKNGKTISLGCPCSYYIKDLLRNYPLKTDLCIDASGYIHNGSPVRISKNDINRLLESYSV